MVEEPLDKLDILLPPERPVVKGHQEAPILPLKRQDDLVWRGSFDPTAAYLPELLGHVNLFMAQNGLQVQQGLSSDNPFNQLLSGFSIPMGKGVILVHISSS